MLRLTKTAKILSSTLLIVLFFLLFVPKKIDMIILDKALEKVDCKILNIENESSILFNSPYMLVTLKIESMDKFPYKATENDMEYFIKLLNLNRYNGKGQEKYEFYVGEVSLDYFLSSCTSKNPCEVWILRSIIHDKKSYLYIHST